MVHFSSILSYSPQVEEQLSQFLEAKNLYVGDLLAEGTQGSVYTLADLKTHKIANVLKITPPNFHFHTHEGPHLVRNIQHPNICSPTQLFYLTSNNKLSLVPKHNSHCIASIMPYIEGATLQHLQQKVSQKAETIFGVGLDTAEGLIELSRQQIAHGDLHPSNIMLTKELKAVLIDFESCHRTDTSFDTSVFTVYLKDLLQKSCDVSPSAQVFLVSCLRKLNDPELMKTFMQACLDHLPEIKPKL